MGTCRRRSTRTFALAASLLAVVLVGAPDAEADVRISNLAVFLNDYDVTVTVVLFGAVPSALHESLHTGIAAHVRYYVELWQHTRMGVDRRLQARMVERQLTYNVLTKDLREAQRVISELRVGQLAPVAALDKQELYYVRVRSDVSLGGVNSWFARMTGEAEETPWVQSSLLTPVRSQ
jgi:hypothetical protein